MSADLLLDRRTGLIDLFDRAKVNGVAYLLVVCTLGSASKADLTEITGEDESTFSKYLIRMESRGLLVRVRDGKADRWHPTAAAIQQLHASDHLLPKISVGASSSSSSDPSDRSVQSELIESDQTEEEGDEREFKGWLCQHYGVTGDKAKVVIADKRILSDDLVAWMLQVGQMKRDGFKFKKSPEAYALHCLLKGDEPNQHALHQARSITDGHWREFQGRLESCAEVANEKVSS